MKQFDNQVSLSFYCYRAIEALRHAFGNNEKEQWEKLRDVLQVERSEIELIQGAAKPLRHGEFVPQSWGSRKQHMLITWHIIRKYIDWQLKNSSN